MCYDSTHPDLWAIGDPNFPRGMSVHDGPEVLDGFDIVTISKYNYSITKSCNSYREEIKFEIFNRLDLLIS